MACRCFCYQCLSTFWSKEAFEKHDCSIEKVKKPNNKNKNKMAKELSHYLTQNYTKGSRQEIATKLETIEDSAKHVGIMNKILRPTYL
jgi:hypothetical protein